MKRYALALFGSVALFVSPAQAVEPDWSARSSAARTQLVELFTSQGCSSCPAAEKWLGRLSTDAGLWRTRVPVNFHVDYWDRLGWTDRYASPLYTKRQYAHVEALGLRSAYTPGFIVDGAEWRGFFERGELPTPAQSRPGVLTAELRDGSVAVKFKPSLPSPEALIFHVAVLGTGVTDDIAAGENRGRELRQDFLVLGHAARITHAGDDASHATSVPLPSPVRADPERWALAVWVTPGDAPTPIQATGGWLPTALAPKPLPGG